MPLPDKIELFVEGDDKRTAFSAAVMNEIINAVNAILAMEGKGGTRVIKSDSKFVIWSSVTGSTSSGSGGTPTSGSGSVTNYYTYCLNRYA